MEADEVSPSDPMQVGPEVERAVERALSAHGAEPGPLLVVLQAITRDLGYVPPEVIPMVARGLNVSRAEVHGVVGFYSDLRTHRHGEHLVQLCRAEACQAVGGTELVNRLTERLGVGLNETSVDGVYTLEGVFCLGNCALGPSAAIDGRLLGRVEVDAMIDQIARLNTEVSLG